MSTTIIYNPRWGEGSRTRRIRRSRERPPREEEAAGGAASPVLVGKTRARRCACVGAAARVLSATGKKPCTVAAEQQQQHRPLRLTDTGERGDRPAEDTATGTLARSAVPEAARCIPVMTGRSRALLLRLRSVGRRG
ncbi:hypothetical protein EYF80_062662 [Liparis tanakae]|uniref:Uncharacterized protein n=1 Tax=Liparis tanakae TaxID=230148 RepID=A0A4Z2EEN4_9TELE|nr:hypothetical protein EYF80_062662 [Liparis tanakae]